MTDVPYRRQPTDFSEPVRYAYGTDSSPQPGVPRGTIFDHVWSTSRVFPGTNRRYWVYVPAQYSPSQPASLMVFQDGHAWLDPDGDMRVPIVFDNLSHGGEMPVTIGVFIDPGIFSAELRAKLGSGGICAFTVAWNALGCRSRGTRLRPPPRPRRRRPRRQPRRRDSAGCAALALASRNEVSA